MWTVVGAGCAELLRSSRVIPVKDRIDEGCSSVYTLWLRHVAHSLPFCSGHPIVVDNEAQSAALPPPVSLLDKKELLPRGYPHSLSDVCRKVRMLCRAVCRPHGNINPGVDNPSIRC